MQNQKHLQALETVLPSSIACRVPFVVEGGSVITNLTFPWCMCGCLIVLLRIIIYIYRIIDAPIYRKDCLKCILVVHITQSPDSIPDLRYLFMLELGHGTTAYKNNVSGYKWIISHVSMYFLGFLIRKLMKQLSKVKEFKIYPINSYSYIICFWWCCSKSTKQRLNYQNFICWILIFNVLIWWWDIIIDYHILFLIGKNFDYRNIKSVSDSFRQSSFSSDLIHLFWLIKKKKKILYRTQVNVKY